MTEWIQGSLAKVKLQNFVTYDFVEFVTGPHLNIIIGPNGTGKSSIVCALCLGLGGKTNLLGRAREVGEFVKHGEDRAIIELELYNKHGINYTIKRIITREDNRSQWFINGKTTNLKEVTALSKKLNIDVDNLCQFLPQDMVAEFAKMTPAQLLESTERAVGGQELVDMHKNLISLKNEQKGISTSQVNKEEYLDKLMKRNDYLKDIVSKYEERSNHLKKIEILELKRPWLVYEIERIKFNKLREGKKAIAARVEVLKEAARPLAESVESAKNDLVESENTIKVVMDEVNKINTKTKRIELNLNTSKEKIDEFLQDYKSKENEEDTKQSKIHRLLNEVNAYNTEIEEMQPVTELKARRDAVGTECKSIARELGKLDSTINEMTAEEQARKSKRRMIESKIQKLNDVRNKKLEMLRRFERDTYNAVEWLRNNKDKFQGEVLEPFQLIINVPNPANAKYIESIISRNDRKAFIFEKADELNIFMCELRDNQKLKINAVLAPNADNFTPAFDFNQLKALGFIGYLSDLIECPPLAKQYLCKYYRIHSVPIGTAAVDRMVDKVNKIITSGLFFTPSNRYQNNRSRYSSDTISSISQLRDSKIFNLTVDMTQVQNLQNELTQLDQDTDICRDRYKDVKQRETDLKTKDQGYREEKTQIGQQIHHRETIEHRVTTRNHKINEMQSTTIDLEKEKKKCEQKVKMELKKCMDQHSNLNVCYVEYETKVHEKTNATIFKISVALHVSDAEDQLQTSTQELQQTQESLEGHNSKISRQRDYAKELLEIAKNTCGLSSNDLPMNYKKMFKKYPCNDVNDLDKQLNEAKALAECSNEVDPQVINEFTDRKKEIETYTKEVEVNQDRLGQLESQIQTIRQKWYGPVSNLVDKINTKFRSFFSILKCAGEVILSEHEDYDKWGIDIRVQFRNSDDLKRLTSSYQSGGEKSVSTILYLLSLQGLTECPFRVVDEINQGMDPKNERKVFEMMADAATVPDTSQYFLITPKLLPELKFNEKMTILGIYNGQGLENTRNASFVVETLIEENRIRCSQLTQS